MTCEREREGWSKDYQYQKSDENAGSRNIRQKNGMGMERLLHLEGRRNNRSASFDLLAVFPVPWYQRPPRLGGPVHGTVKSGNEHHDAKTGCRAASKGLDSISADEYPVMNRRDVTEGDELSEIDGQWGGGERGGKM